VKHIDLFSGIGGFAYAAREVWGEEYENVCFCEINKYAQAVIKKNFGKDVTIYGDIRTLTNPRHSVGCTEQEQQQKERPEVHEGSDDFGIDLLTGGFPCQPFSQAGKRKGTNDDRFLWPEMLRVIREFKPRWVVGENVRGLLTIEQGMVFENCCLDLEREGYTVQAFVIPACAVGAPHRRDRVWIVAHHHSLRPQVPGSELEAGRDRQDDQDARTNPVNPGLQRGERPGAHESGEAFAHGATPERGDVSGDAPNSRCEYGARTTESRESSRPLCGEKDAALPKRPVGDASNPRDPRLQRREQNGKGHCGQSGGIGGDQRPDWTENWLEIATRFCGVDDGLPADMDGVTLSKAGHRVERLKALGNAIVPQVAVQIFRGLKLADLMESI